MKDLERRIGRMENHLNLSKKPQTLEDMIAAFEKCEYGHNSIMSLVGAILKAGNGERLKKDLPAKLIDFFVETLRRTPPYEGYRERKDGESEKDYLAYKILECKAVAGLPELPGGEEDKSLKEGLEPDGK